MAMNRDPLEAVSEHNDTFTRCPACAQTFLFADAAECDGCEAYLHPECRVTCEECSYAYCPNCHVGGVCEGCRRECAKAVGVMRGTRRRAVATSVRKKFRPVDFMHDVGEELARARILFPVQESTLTPHEWLAILLEEVGEVARGLNDEQDWGDVYQELVQSAAMCARMALSIKNRADG